MVAEEEAMLQTFVGIKREDTSQGKHQTIEENGYRCGATLCLGDVLVMYTNKKSARQLFTTGVGITRHCILRAGDLKSRSGKKPHCR